MGLASEQQGIASDGRVGQVKWRLMWQEREGEGRLLKFCSSEKYISLRQTNETLFGVVVFH